MPITKPQVRTAWADAAVNPGDIYDPDLDLAGSVAAGWKLSARPPARQYFNWLINYAHNGIRYFSRRGVVDWDPLETYMAGDIVRGDNGVLLQCLQNGNTNQLPSSALSWWGRLAGYAMSADLSAYVTQPSLASQLTAYHTIAAFNAAISNYYTQAQVNALLATYDTIAARNTALAPYHTTAAFNAAIASYSTTAQMNAALSAYATLGYLAANYNTWSATVSYITGNYWPASYIAANFDTISARNLAIANLDTIAARAAAIAGLPQIRTGIFACAAGQPGTFVALGFTTLLGLTVSGGPNASQFQTVCVLSQSAAGFYATASANGYLCSYVAWGH